MAKKIASGPQKGQELTLELLENEYAVVYEGETGESQIVCADSVELAHVYASMLDGEVQSRPIFAGEWKPIRS